MANTGFTANGVSVLGIGIAIIGAVAAAWSCRLQSHPLVSASLLVAGAICVQLRLVCNMIDGMIAMENGLKTKLGDLFNEFPDRIEDPVLLLGAGYASGSDLGVTLAWTAALFSVATAYVRQLGAALGCGQDFCGPLAKPQRMFFLTLTLLISAAMVATGGSRLALVYGLGFIATGTGVTVVRRLVRLGKVMQSQ